MTARAGVRLSWAALLLTAAACLGGDPPSARPRTGPAPQPRLDGHGDPLPPGAFARIGTTRLWTRCKTPPLAYSPDGKLIASGEYDGKVHLWDPATGKDLLCLDG